MKIQLYNSLSKTKEELIPIKDKTIKMYSCGVTVYDRCHIGHARSLYIFDVIKRYLRFRGFDVHFVRNITDVDDKIINRANELGKTSAQVADDNVAAYQEDLKMFAIDQADIEPRATENIPEIIKAIAILIEKGFAYESQGDVYYSVRSFKDYGKLSGQSIDHMLENVRIENDPRKKDPMDFALWKSSKENEPSWESPWGGGRPGWHIECTCMSMKHLDCETLDIHAGGRDLIFPHHENEVAQSEALTGKPFAKYWIHHGLLTIEGQKMSKSIGNFITIQDALKKHSVDALKMFFLTSHYASPIDFTEGKMEDAQKALQKFDTLFWKASNILKDFDGKTVYADFVKNNEAKVLESMDDDFNTAKALGFIYELLTETNKYIDEQKKSSDYAATVDGAVSTLERILNGIFGLFKKEESKELSEQQQQLLQDRINARANKDFQKSDELRDVLKAESIIVEDGKDGQVWRWA